MPTKKKSALHALLLTEDQMAVLIKDLLIQLVPDEERSDHDVLLEVIGHF